MRKNICDLLGIAQIPDNPASFGLTVCNHASSQFAGSGRGRGGGVAVAKELRGGLELPGDCRKPCHQSVMTFARDAVALLQHDADVTLHYLNPAAEQMHCDRRS